MPLRLPPAGPPAGAGAVRDFLYTKGDLRPFEVATCLVIWLTDARGLRSVSAVDIRAHYRPRDRPPAAAPMRSVSDALRRAQRAGLLADAGPELTAAASPMTPPDRRGHACRIDAATASPLTRGIPVARRLDTGPRFVPTALGRRVVDALPDKREVGTLRGLVGAAALYRSSARLVP